MPKIWFTTESEPLRRQHIDAPSLPAALLTLQSRGPQVTAAGLQAPARPLLPRPAWRLLTSVYEQLASLLDQGQELSGALRRLSVESVTPRLSRSLTALSERVSQGFSLSEALAEQPHVYSSLVVNTVAAAEESGDLPGGLRSLAEHQRELETLSADISLPLIYPLLLLCLIGVLILLFTSTFILPKFISLFRELGLKDDEFPYMTRFAMGVSNTILTFGPAFLIAAGVAGIIYRVRRRVHAGRLGLRLFGLPVPFFSRLAQDTALARAAACLRLLLRQGAPMDVALRLAGEASGSYAVELALRRAEYTLREGGSLAEGLRETGLLPESFVFSLSGAEASGDLVEVLQHLETDYRRDVRQLAHTWVAVAGPLVVIGVGFMIGFMALSMYLPLVSIIQKLSGS